MALFLPELFSEKLERRSNVLSACGALDPAVVKDAQLAAALGTRALYDSLLLPVVDDPVKSVGKDVLAPVVLDFNRVCLPNVAITTWPPDNC